MKNLTSMRDDLGYYHVQAICGKSGVLWIGAIFFDYIPKSLSYANKIVTEEIKSNKIVFVFALTKKGVLKKIDNKIDKINRGD